jgi:hypothetical protein
MYTLKKPIITPFYQLNDLQSGNASQSKQGTPNSGRGNTPAPQSSNFNEYTKQQERLKSIKHQYTLSGKTNLSGSKTH